MDEKQNKEREHFFGAAKVIAGLTLLSRVLGMVRDMTIFWLGAKWQNSAFQFAFFLPNLFRRLFGEGALSAAFVPVFTETSETGGAEKASRLLSNAMALLAIFMLAVMILTQVGLLVFVWLSPPERVDRQFLVLLSSIMLPFMVTICLLALGAAALNCRGHFAYPAFAPILLNLCMIAADGVAYVFWPGNVAAQLETISVSVVVAGVLQLLGVLWLLRRTGFVIRMRIRPIEPGIGRMLKMMGPALLVMGFLQLSTLFDYLATLFFAANEYVQTLRIFGWEFPLPLSEGTLVHVVAATRIGQFPMGVFAISLGVAVFPLLSRYAHRNDMPNLCDSINRALRLAIMEGLASGIGLFVLAGPIIKLLYRHGDFTTDDADKVATLLQFYVMGMWAYCSYQILTRSFYSLKDSRTPMRVSCVLAVVYMVVVTVLIWVPGVGQNAFGLTPAITFSINAAVLIYLLRRRVGPLGGRRIAFSVMRSLLAGAAMAGAIYLLRWLMCDAQNWQIVATCVPAGAAVFVGAAYLMRAPELGELLGAMRRKKPEQVEAK